MDPAERVLAFSHLRATTSGGLLVRLGCAGILFVAAGFKAHQLVTDPALGTLYGSRWLQFLLIEYEVLLASWLVSGAFQRYCRWVALVTFATFAGYTLYLGTSGAASCGCFGRSQVNPWWMVAVDSLAVMLLLRWQPAIVVARLAQTTIAAAMPVVVGIALAIDSIQPLGASSAGVDAPAVQSFLAPGPSHACNNQCIPGSVSILRASLGLDPDDGSLTTDSKELLDFLGRAAHSTGAQMRPMSLRAFLDTIEAGPTNPAAMIDENGHIYIVLGAIDVEGETLLQLIHGNSPVILVPEDRIASSMIEQIWVVSRPASGTPLRVGDGELRANALYHNFGEVLPNQKLEFELSLSNTGSHDVHFGAIESSCQCTATVPPDSTVLRPGDAVALPVAAQAAGPSFRQTVNVRLIDDHTGLSRTVFFTLFASQRTRAVVSEPAFDFGTVLPTRAYTRRVTVTEVPTERLTLLGVDSGKLPIQHQVETSLNGQGYRVYRVTSTLLVDASWSGRHFGRITLTIDSPFRHDIVLPVTFEVAPKITVVPSTVAFGVLRKGEKSTQRVRLMARDGAPLSAEVAKPSSDSSVRVEMSDTSAELAVTLTASEPGIWQCTIQCNVQSGSHRELLVIPCSAFIAD